MIARARQMLGMHGIRRVFANRNYAIYASGNTLSLIGTWVQRLGVGWLAWDLTHSGFWLGAVAFADLFPALAMGLFGGVLADRHERRTIMLTGQWLSLTQATALWLLNVTGVISIHILFVLSLIMGTVTAGIQPARLAFVPSLVGQEDIGGAVAINAVIFNIARFVGPAIAGVIITSIGVGYAFGFNALTYLALIIALHALRVPLGTDPGRRGASVLGDVWSGLEYAFTHAGVAPVLLLTTASSLLVRPAFELLPAFADAVFAAGPTGLAMLTSAIGLGALAAGLWLAQRASAAGFTAISFYAGVASAASVALFTAASNIWVAACAMVVCGCSIAVLGVCTQTLIQTGVPAHMRGRVLSMWGVVVRGAPALGALLMGWASDVTGLRIPLAVGGVLCFLAALALWRQRAGIARLEAGQPS